MYTQHLCIKQVIEKRNATNQETHLLFVDFKKSYDSIPISKFWEVLGDPTINNSLNKAMKKSLRQYCTSENWKQTIPHFQYY